MKISKKMRNEIKCILHFLPDHHKFEKHTDEDIEKYFEWSSGNTMGMREKEIFKTENKQYPNADIMMSREKYSGLASLLWGNAWRNRHIYEIYEPSIIDFGLFTSGIMDEETPYYVLKYLAKTLFRGIFKDDIYEKYNLGGR